MSVSSKKISPDNGKRIAFIDLEASGLGVKSWPVEVAWIFDNGDLESHLIRPHKDWPLSAWVEEAEALHGLSIDRLTREGADGGDICRALNKSLQDCAVYSDAPDWDSFWLYRLFKSHGQKQTFQVLNFVDLVGPMMEDRVAAIVDQATAEAPKSHRASNDAKHLHVIYKLASA